MAGGAACCRPCAFATASAAIYALPAAEFVRATNRVPLALWDRDVALGAGLLLLVGVQTYGFWFLGDVLHDAVKREFAGPS